MPNRVLRDGILTSDRVNKLSVDAELFYRRLMSVVDDFGCFDGRASIIRAACYPLRIDAIRPEQVELWISECLTAGLITTYESSGHRYVELLDFRQRLRAKNRKCPPPPTCQSYDGHMTVICPHEAEAEAEAEALVEAEAEAEAEGRCASALSNDRWNTLSDKQRRKLDEKPDQYRQVWDAVRDAGGDQQLAYAACVRGATVEQIRKARAGCNGQGGAALRQQLRRIGVAV